MGKIKISEARILVYLENVSKIKRFASLISAKLGIEYGYCLRVLKTIQMKGWVSIQQTAVKKHYFLTTKAPIKEAKDRLQE